LHIAVALMKAGQARSPPIDLDAASKASPATSATESAWARRTGLRSRASGALLHQAWHTMQIADNETSEFEQSWTR